ncbi:bifunctional proline dehydrogenase/L-glutamate gamma-semialdehyde dehydrogenase PutA [Agaribacterium sp. ZY112]|uniref:bifunctional proline dehydrogenase/L-glutamate gamma-semialdehyde dehydrogenase PutA n=1 Tax=Agaribacterium sp. ZY112 TaxID=3233574 RepID=UPI003524832B
MLFQHKLDTDCPLRQTIRQFYRADEEQVVDHILPLAEIGVSARSRAWERARQLVINIRKTEESGVNALLNEYSLSSEEGVMLMCLAEALLRVPDQETQDELIRDKLAKGEWSQHLGHSDSLFVNVSSWGLLITGKVVNYGNKNQADKFGLLKRTLGRLGEPAIRASVQLAMKVMGKQFVMASHIDQAIERAKDTETKGYVYSYDMLGEGARTMLDAERFYNAYLKAIHALGKAAASRGPILSPGISVKLSALHPRYEFEQQERVLAELIPKLKALALVAKDYDIGFTIDAEEARRLELSLDIIENVFSDAELGNWQGFGIAVQAYQKRAIFVIDWIEALARRTGRKIMLRLVKGAYWDSEIKTAQESGMHDFPVFTRKATTDVSYKACAIKLMAARDVIYPQFATHNAYTVATILELAQDDRQGFEFQRLHGMGESLYDQVVLNEHVQCRVYAPVGEHEDLLAYLVRRLLENGANSSFVNAIVDDSKAVEELLPDPVEKLQDLENKRNAHIKLPSQLYGAERKNSKGLDITDIKRLSALKKHVDAWADSNISTSNKVNSNTKNIVNPALHSECLGQLQFHSAKEIKNLVSKAESAFKSWSSYKIKKRTNILRRSADILERHRDELIAICIKEAGKLTSDSIDEVREAVDFCRYYAARAEELAQDERLEARGVVLCISPWNFPLAIFIGQVAAAIVTGNTVIAKPAEQTCLIAKRGLELMHTVGLPKDVVQLVFSDGHTAGEHIVSDKRIQAVMFTGSTTTGRLISKILAERGGKQVPLIAETGGQNCMIVDSTALPEQVCDDVIKSGFQSAGQRCSALRVLYLQEDIAETIIAMLIGAMKELKIGDPQWLATDVGPVIDHKALSALQEHVNYMRAQKQTDAQNRLLFECPMPNMGHQEHNLFAPRLYELSHLSVLTKEVFGPIVHIIRYKADELDSVIEQINQSGFGLTMAIHSRIEERCHKLAHKLRAGNIYINRNMIGAIVGTQPFGGRGLSGTGPKAGGPHYLKRLVKEKHTPSADSINYNSNANITMEDAGTAREHIDGIMELALKADKIWRCTELNDRISVMRQLLAKVATVDIVDELADDLAKSLSDSRAQLTLIEKRLKKPALLTGPTGETNLLYLEARGCIVCYADQDTKFSFWLMAIISALAVGNTVITAVSDIFYEEAKAIKEQLIACGATEGALQVVRHNQLKALLHHQDITATVVDSNSARMGYFSKQLSEREGAILPVISAEYNDTLIQRLVTEKTISINTTASGGNTSLMNLDDDE